jgi:hypothetical protein
LQTLLAHRRVTGIHDDTVLAAQVFFLLTFDCGHLIGSCIVLSELRPYQKELTPNQSDNHTVFSIAVTPLQIVKGSWHPEFEALTPIF